MIKHFPTCNADYPEKPEGELPQHIVEIDIATHDSPNERLFQCSDCGAFVVCECDKRNPFRCTDTLIRCGDSNVIGELK